MPIAFLCPGQASQKVGMGKDIYNNTEKTLNIKRIRKCYTCMGIGFTMDGLCKECHGKNYCEYMKKIVFYCFIRIATGIFAVNYP